MIRPIFTGRLRGLDTLFFLAPKANAERMPWVSAAPLIEACGVPRKLRARFEELWKFNPTQCKRIETASGKTTVMSFTAARELVRLSVERGWASQDASDAYADLVFEAAKTAYPDRFQHGADEQGRRWMDMSNLAWLLGNGEVETGPSLLKQFLPTNWAAQ